MTEYRPHPIADIFPLILGKEFVDLKTDIKEKGLIEPIWIYEDKILDGRNRFRACQEVGAEIKTREYVGGDPVGFVISLNLARRHLSESQRASVAARLANMTREDTLIQNRSANLRNDMVSQSKAAEMLNVSPRSVTTAKKVHEEGIPELVEKVDSGEISVSAAALAAALDDGVQHEIIHEINDGGRVLEVIKKHVHVSQNSGENEWYTPPEFIEAARSVMGCIDLDPASSDIANNIVKADKYYTKANDGLFEEWKGNIWMNPPYSQPLVSNFIDKFINSEFNQAVILVNNATETKWFQSIAEISQAICFPSSRIKFLDVNGEPKMYPLQGQSLLYFGDDKDKFINEFKKFGFVVVSAYG